MDWHRIIINEFSLISPQTKTVKLFLSSLLGLSCQGCELWFGLRIRLKGRRAELGETVEFLYCCCSSDLKMLLITFCVTIDLL